MGEETGVIPSGGEENPVPSATAPEVYKSYKRRFYIFATVCVLNLSNGMLWIDLAPIAHIANAYYGDDSASDAFSLCFMVVSIPLMFLSMWGIDSFGLRPAIWIGATLNATGASIRFLADFASACKVRYIVAMFGQVLCAAAQPAIMFLPTKMCALWFPPNERVVINSLSSMSNPLGIMTAYLSSPQIVPDTAHMRTLNGIMLGPAGLGFIMAFAGVWHSLPPTPPCVSAAKTSLPFTAGFRACFKNRSFLILIVCVGGGLGFVSALFTLLQHILCVKGYNQTVVGTSGALLIVGGLIGSGIAGELADRTKRFQEILKTSYAITVAITAGMSYMLLKSGLEAGVYTLIFFFGFFGFPIYPVGLETGVEVTYPVAEATSSGLIIIWGQVVGVVMLLVMSGLAAHTIPASHADLEHYKQFCLPPSLGNATERCAVPETQNNSPVPNFLLTMMAYLSGMLGCALLLGLTFWPKYRRLEADTDKQGEEEEGSGSRERDGEKAD